MAQAGVSPPYDRIVGQVYTPGRHGSLQLDMLAAPRRFGLVSYPVPPSLTSLLQLNAEGHSPVVLLNLGLDWLPRWHYALVVGHDLIERDIILTSGTQALQRMPLHTFELMWSRAGQWGMVVSAPDKIPLAIQAAEAEKAALSFERVNPPASAAQAWKALNRRWPDRLLPRLGLSHAYMQDQHWTLAKDTLLETTAKFDSAVAWNNLAQVWLSLGDAPRALAAIEKARLTARASEPQWLPTIEETAAEIARATPLAP
ncbi:MAG: PA2778 family cysteine peptidase [Aquabacterium sp.]